MEIKFRGEKSGREYSFSEPVWTGVDGELLNLEINVIFDPKNVKNRVPNLWRYREVIPLLDDSNRISFGEGYTPLVSSKLQNNFTAFLKHDYLFPSGSYKDRGASVMMSRVKEMGIKHIVQDSSGNAGASVAAYAAVAGIKCDIYVPENTPLAKTSQIAAYGARVLKVDGDRKETARVAYLAAQESYYASHCFNPLFLHGTKTFAYEICEQMDWSAPDSVVLPAGNGTLLLGAFIGFSELTRAGIISKMPRLIAVQSENCNPLFRLNFSSQFQCNNYTPSETLAEGIAIPNPVRIHQMLNAVLETGGEVVCVSESEITDTWKWAAENGMYMEPTSAATIAGLVKFTNGLSADEKVVSVITGSGLKSTEKIMKMMAAKG